MTGDDRTRHCALCELNVHNVAGMSRDEVARLVGESNGRLCVRLVRRADGLVMTKDCPVGLRAYRKRVAAFASAVFAAVLSFCSVSYAQRDDESVRTMDGSKLKIVRSNYETGAAALQGTLVDSNGAVIPGVAVWLTPPNKKVPLASISDAEGKFSFGRLSPGVYDLETTSILGFRKLIVRKLELVAGKVQELILDLDAVHSEMVGVLALDLQTEPEIVDRKIDFSLLEITPRPVKKP